MAVFTEPTKWAQTLGKDADVTAIPNTAGDTDPSIDKIFPSVFSIPLAQGGRAIPRSVLNGLFKLLGDWSFYQQNGGIASYSNAFDYAVGSFVKYSNQLYICVQANGVSTTIKAPTETAYWSKVTTLADVSGAFANQSFSNVNDNANILMAHNAMPSNVYDDLTAPQPSGTTYTVVADGWFNIDATMGNDNGTFNVQINSTIALSEYTTNTRRITFLFPVKKGDSVFINYNSNYTINNFRFIYAVGSESEQ